MPHHPVLLAVAFAVVTVASADWWASAFRRSRTLLDRWAADNRYRIVTAEWRIWRRGPYVLSSGDAQWVFRLAVVDAAGRQREGFARVGGLFLGLISDAVDVTWDDGR